MSEGKVISSDDVLVRAQDTPNPYAYKFIINHSLKNEGKATFSVRAEAEGLPLVETLFEVPGVRQIYLFQNTATITHDGSEDGESLKDKVSVVLKTRLPIHDPAFLGPDEQPAMMVEVDRSHLPKELQEIEEILDRTIRPGLQADGGDVEVMGYENNELRILYQGACGGCPSAMMGTLDAIQNILSHEMNNPELRVIPL